MKRILFLALTMGLMAANAHASASVCTGEGFTVELSDYADTLTINGQEYAFTNPEFELGCGKVEGGGDFAGGSFGLDPYAATKPGSLTLAGVTYRLSCTHVGVPCGQ